MGASISESSGIRQAKKSRSAMPTTLSPTVHRTCIFCVGPIAFERLTWRYGELQPAMPVAPWRRGPRGGMVSPNPGISGVNDRIKNDRASADCAGGPSVPGHHLGGLGIQLARDEV